MNSPKYIGNYIISLDALNVDDIMRECSLLAMQMHTIAESIACDFFQQEGVHLKEEEVFSQCSFPLVIEEIEKTISLFQKTFSPETWETLMESNTIFKGSARSFSTFFLHEDIYRNLLMSIYNKSQEYTDERRATAEFLKNVDAYYMGLSHSIVEALTEKQRLREFSENKVEKTRSIFQRMFGWK